MYHKDDSNQLKFEDFYLPFGGKLRSDNRWVVLSKQIPWQQIEQQYSVNFSDNKVGCPAKSARIALGSLIIKERLLTQLSPRQYRDLLVIKELYRQQLLMYKNHSHEISDRIISISQPHIRPIVRGKAKSNVEFEAKVSLSLINRFSFVDKISWDNYNESGDLIGQIKKYRDSFGFYPKSVHGDLIYRTRDNLRYCKKHGIRLSGPPLGRPKKVTVENSGQLKLEKQQYRQDEIDRIAIEGKFGQGKCRFSLNRIMAKLAGTSETVIIVAFMVMNLEKILSGCLCFLLRTWHNLLTVLKDCCNYAKNLRWLLKVRIRVP